MFTERLVSWTESFLTRRRAKRRVRREQQKKKNPVLDWVEAFLWAACYVLLINQYLLQAYAIPSGSMIDTLLIGDHVFVNKLVYGPELLPGLGKTPGFRQPKRNDIIIFENPSYISRGTAFDVAQRLIYMLTLSLVDIDKDENGQPKAHFLIKRAVGMSGDIFINDRGNMKIRFAGEAEPIDELVYNKARGWTHRVSRLSKAADYEALFAASRAQAWYDLGLSIPSGLAALAQKANQIEYPDYLSYERPYLETIAAANPQDARYSARLARTALGWYVPEERVLPLGDNRDNSRDGRFFGPVPVSRVLGEGLVKYWPPGRIGVIK